jgi:hypothetical protein
MTCRDLQRIAHDMNVLLFKYSGNYQGSPYKGDADSLIQEFNEWCQKEYRLNTRTFSTWNSLETAIQEILFGGRCRFSLSETNDMTAEIIRAVKRLGLGRDIDGKLDQVIPLAENLKASNNSIS